MRFLARRGALFLVTLWAALTINFVIPRVMPGNEASAVLGTFRGVNPAALHALQIEFGVNTHQSVLSSYFEYLGNMLTGQFGVTSQGVPVMNEITSKLPWTLLLVGVSTVIAFASVTAVYVVYSMRNNMITTIAEDYVKTAKSKGLADRRVMYDYAARNAILPNLTGFAMQLGYVLGGAIVIEYLFSYPGLGYLFYTATTDHDLPLMQGLFLFYTLAVLVCVLIADLLTAILDPRTREARWR